MRRLQHALTVAHGTIEELTASKNQAQQEVAQLGAAGESLSRQLEAAEAAIALSDDQRQQTQVSLHAHTTHPLSSIYIYMFVCVCVCVCVCVRVCGEMLQNQVGYLESQRDNLRYELERAGRVSD